MYFISYINYCVTPELVFITPEVVSIIPEAESTKSLNLFINSSVSLYVCVAQLKNLTVEL